MLDGHSCTADRLYHVAAYMIVIDIRVVETTVAFRRHTNCPVPHVDWVYCMRLYYSKTGTTDSLRDLAERDGQTR
ncbi:hypothetical protein QE152_g15269 [Popillia japonica]|uniref:Uncharacterized protein n=1 Tax=Popillia japonica TaxID=7064 RepID=A0AAW1L958_POPJA